MDAVPHASNAMKLSQLFKDFSYNQKNYHPDDMACGIANDSRDVLPGYIFVCIKGKKVDGHRYISQAISKGAIAVVVEDLSNLPSDINYLLVDSTKEAYSLLYQRWTDEVWKKFNLIAVTGTTGKTTIAFLAHQTLLQLGLKSALIGTAGYYSGEKRLALTMKGPVTTPEPKALHELFQFFGSEDCKAVCLEASSFGLSEKRLHGIQFDVAILSNLAFNHHIGFHGGWMDYVKAKSTLFDMLKKEGTAILNADEKHLDLFLKKNTKTILYGSSESAQVKICDLSESLNGISFSLLYKNTKYRIESSLQGAFQAWNLAAVFALGLSMNYKPCDLVTALQHTASIPGRWDVLLKEAPFTVVIDKANTPIAIEALRSLIQNNKYHRRIGVFGNVGGGDYAERVILAQSLSEIFDELILTLDDPEDEDIWNNFNEFLSGIPPKNRRKVHLLLSRKQALERAVAQAKQKDLILVLGRGNQREFIVRGHSEVFDDVEEMSLILNQKGYMQ